MAQSFFIHKLFIPGDEAGFGMWRSEHSDQHQQFVQIARGFTVPIQLKEFDILSWNDDVRFQALWNLAHFEIHKALRESTGIDGMDFSLIDWSDDKAVSIFLENHQSEHELYEQAFGLT